ncbi:SSD domain-containing protein [Aphelenchoides bicaudatus]|nr:SSD domain-containing protein [Aphelenchoides bicaudatus]
MGLRVSKSTADNQSNRSDEATVISSDSNETVLLRFVHKAYKYWAQFIVNNTVAILITCTLLTCFCSGKLFLTPQKNILTGYTPYGSRSIGELAIKSDFFEQDGPETTVMIFLQDIRGKNVLTLKHLEEIVKIDEYVRHNFTMFNKRTQKEESFDQFCTSFCRLNEPLRIQNNSTRIVNSTGLTHLDKSNIRLNYPIFELYNFKINIQPSIYGVHLKKGFLRDEESNLLGADMVALTYKAGQIGAWTPEEINKYEQAISDYFINEYRSSNLKIMVLNPTFAQSELIRSGFLLMPAIFMGFVIMVCVSVTTVLISATYFRQVNIHKISLAVFACVCPLMASSTALGLLFFAGVRFSSVLCVSPFLVLAIGVDDAYLMIHSWQRVTKEMRHSPTSEDSVAHRLSLVLVETGPAILISALTNFMADLVGSFTGSPEVTLLCVGNMASIVVDFIYQITFYTAVMAIAGKFELEAEQRSNNKLCIQIGAVELKPTMFIDGLPQKPSNKRLHDKIESGFQIFVVKYVKFITNIFVCCIVFVCWIAFIVFSIYWTTKFEQLLKFDKMVAKNSPLLEIEHLRETLILPHYTVATVFVNNPGNLADPERLSLLNEMVTEFESLPESWGRNSTFLFTRDFLNFEQNGNSIDDEEETDEDENRTKLAPRTAFRADDLPSFLEWPEFSYFKGFIKLHTESNHTTLDRFFFQCAYKGKKLREWNERGKLLLRWRQIVDKFSSFNATVFNDESVFLDLIENMSTDCWQSIVGTLFCVGLVCFVFIYNSFTVVVVFSAVASIMIGMLGVLSWQHITMDPVLLAAIIISIGFSIDIPTHISYHYHSAGIESPGANVQQRLIASLSSVGFPALQASLSTSLVIIALIFVPLYMAFIFVRVMYLCMALCILHSLVILPALFTLMNRLCGIIHCRKSQN